MAVYVIDFKVNNELVTPFPHRPSKEFRMVIQVQQQRTSSRHAAVKMGHKQDTFQSQFSETVNVKIRA